MPYGGPAAADLGDPGRVWGVSQKRPPSRPMAARASAPDGRDAIAETPRLLR